VENVPFSLRKFTADVPLTIPFLCGIISTTKSGFRDMRTIRERNMSLEADLKKVGFFHLQEIK
jgi:hypothetical protein